MTVILENHLQLVSSIGITGLSSIILLFIPTFLVVFLTY